MAPELGDQAVSKRQSGGEIIEHVYHCRKEEVADPFVYLKRHGAVCPGRWGWNDLDKASEVDTDGDRTKVSVTFHPHWSNGTAAIRASRPLIGYINYWEIHVGDRLFGTSLMFGVTTRRARLQAHEFKNLIGEDVEGWGLSHKGRIYHDGESNYFCRTFAEHTPVVVGILLDRWRGDMTFYKDGVCLGVAFIGLDKVEDDLYPTICSTAAKSHMVLGRRRRSFVDLQDRCRHVVTTALLIGCASAGSKWEVLDQLPLPNRMKQYIKIGF